MSDADALKFYRSNSWTPYEEALRWRRRFWCAAAVIAGLGLIVLWGSV